MFYRTDLDFTKNARLATISLQYGHGQGMVT